MDRLAITIAQVDITQHIALARKYNVGIEIQVYGYDPDLLDNDWRAVVAQHKTALRGFTGEIALHGAFYDMSSASNDSRITALTRERYLQNLDIAAELGAHNVVFHTNYLPIIRHPDYLPPWTGRQVAFWRELAERARQLGLVIALENMWEPEPEIIGDVLEQIGSPSLAACLDVGHVHLFSDSLPVSAWVERLEKYLVHCHLNNNQGVYDNHLALDAEGGEIPYDTIIPLLENLSPTPLVCLEMDNLADLERSLRYLGR